MRHLLIALVLVGCTGDKANQDGDAVGILGEGWANPFPSHHLVVDGKLALDPADLPVIDGGSELRLERLSFRTGFSPVQTAVLQLPGMSDAELPSWRQPVPGEGSVWMADLTTGELLPVMAELDAYPDLEDPSLLIRPQVALPHGHDIAVAVTTEVVARPDRFDALVSGDPPASLEGDAEHYVGLLDTFEGLGLSRDDVAVTWSFPVGDGRAPLWSALDQGSAEGTWEWTRIRKAGEDTVPPYTWTQIEGTFDVTDFLQDDRALDIQDDGSVIPTGTAQARFLVHVPDSVKDADAGTVPVMVFGHGIFSDPGGYLDNDEDSNGVLLLAEELGCVVVATEWRGLASRDRPEALEAAVDFARISDVTDRLVQAHVNTVAMIDLVTEHGLFEDEALLGTSGQVLANPDALVYYGISLGGIEGAVLNAHEPRLQAGVLHVGGGAWSSMLERSTQWPIFETFVVEKVPDAGDRQMLYALSQLYWDPANPFSWTDELSDQVVMWQESLGDEQVPNMSTRALARTTGALLLEPPVEEVWGVDTVASPSEPGQIGMSQFDAEVDLPPDENRPYVTTGAHGTPRKWQGSRLQTIDYLTPPLGTMVHHCGDAPCTASNPGP